MDVLRLENKETVLLLSPFTLMFQVFYGIAVSSDTWEDSVNLTNIMIVCFPLMKFKYVVITKLVPFVILIS